MSEGSYYNLLYLSNLPLVARVGSAPYWGTLSGLPQKIQDILVGSLLGDAYASKHGKNLGNTRIEFKQGINHSSYLFCFFISNYYFGGS